jgi:hypothetical protein
LIEKDGAPYVIGVSSANTGDPHCAYGTTEHYSRVSDELPWIRGVMVGSVPAEDQPRLMRFRQGTEGTATVARVEAERTPLSSSARTVLLGVLEQLVAAIEAEDPAVFFELFTERYLAGHRANPEPGNSMWDFLAQVRAKRGDIVRFHPLPEEGLRTEDSAFPMQPVVFHLQDGTPGYFGLALDDAGQIDHFSLFVMARICSEGASCTLGGTLKELQP